VAVTATPAFKDHFSGQSQAYRRYRPEYPPELFDWLAAVAPARELAVDVASGSGQAAVALAARFRRVIATDPSAAQLAAAPAHPRVEYRCEAAESISVEPGSVDLLVAAQAAHWLEWPRFVAEALRVLRTGGVLAFWTYGNCHVTPEIDHIIAGFSRDVVGPYWPRERRHVDEGYRELAVPLVPLAVPPFEMRTRWDARAMRSRCSPCPLPRPGATVRGTCAGRSSCGLIAPEPRLVATRNRHGRGLPYTPRPLTGDPA
jgi:SAM-dependent methyltransferase